jgi:signal transduction histidine kinase
MSFRTRIFAISILITSAVLAIVITLSWSRIAKVELERLDSRLCMEARRITPRGETPRFTENGSRYNVSEKGNQLEPSELSNSPLMEDLVDKLRVDSSSQLMILVESTEHNLLIKTDDVDIKKLINTLDWVKVGTPEISYRNRENASCYVASFEYKSQQWRAGFYQASNKQSFAGVEVAATTSEFKSTLREAMVVVIPFSLLLSILGAWIITSNTIRPINRLHKSMDLVTQKDLSQRLPVNKEDKEFQVLINAYNTMLDRLEDSFQQISRFTSDAAHELKTPLTVLRGKLEQAVLSEDSSQLDVNAILDEVGNLSAITRKLLLLSQADSRSMALHFESVNITELLDELIADVELLAEDLELHCSIEQALITKADIVLLTQLLNNLLVNMIRYSVHEKGVTIKAKKTHSSIGVASIEVVISNYCQPISNDVRNQLFDRFYRAESEHMQGISGSGLGLSLAREIARAHGGDLTIENSDNDVFSIRLYLPLTS